MFGECSYFLLKGFSRFSTFVQIGFSKVFFKSYLKVFFVRVIETIVDRSFSYKFR